jgi:hypothetical protein
MPSINSFTASTTSICAGQSVTLTATASDAELYSFDNGANWGYSASTVVSPSTTTTYILKVTRTEGGCTVTSTPVPITVHPLPAPAFVNPPACLVNNAVLTVNDGNNVASSYCFRYECANCTHNPYLTGNDDPAAAGCYWFSECQYGTANTYTVSTYDPGTITVWAKTITQYGCVDSVSTTLAARTQPTQTYGVGSQYWSVPIKIPDCKKGSMAQSTSSADCQSRTRSDGIELYYYNWTYVNTNKDCMCQTPWRLPTQADAQKLLAALGSSPTAGVYVPESSTWGGSPSGYAAGTTQEQPTLASPAWYWLANKYTLSVNSSTAQLADYQTMLWLAFQVRCVKDGK